MEQYSAEKRNQIVIVDGHTFELQEMGNEELHKYADLQRLMEFFYWRAVKKNTEIPLEYILETETAILKLILRDKSEIVNKDFADALSFRQKKILLKIQDLLNA